jgi:predicted ribosomally synthesized peptide with SipW-like signal peptide
MSNDITLSRRKLLGSIGVLGVGAAGAGGAGTYAYFTDEGSVQDNRVQTGELDLEVGGQSDVSLTVQGAAPGESGSTAVAINNTGNVGGQLSVEVNITGYNTNDAGDNEPTYPQSGELRDELQVAVGFGSDSGAETVITPGSIGTADLLGAVPAHTELTGSGAPNLVIEWAVDGDATDEIMTDVIEFEVVVRADQRPPTQVSSTSDLRTAVDEAAPGEVIRLADATFSISSPLPVDVSGVTLQPQQGASPTISATAAENPAAVHVTADDVLIDGVDIQQNNNGGKCVQVNGSGGPVSNTDPGVSGVAVTNLEVRNADQRGITAGRCENVVFKNVHTEDHTNSGMEFWYTYNSRMEGVTAANNTDNGIYVNGANCAILNCEAYGNSDQGVDVSFKQDVTSVDADNHILVDNVHSHDNDNAGIELHDDDTDDSDPADSKLVKNCRTENNSWDSMGDDPGEEDIDEAGLVLNQVTEDEVQVVNSHFPEGIKSGTGTDLDP